jgi:hypothetical protein
MMTRRPWWLRLIAWLCSSLLCGFALEFAASGHALFIVLVFIAYPLAVWAHDA